MPFDAKLYRVLVAGPSDTQLDRETAAQIIYRWNHDQTWNHDNAKGKRIVLLPALWETDPRPQQGKHPQILIDRQMVADCDAMVAIFRTRLGSPTKTHISGTVEELEVIRGEGKEVMVYFYDGDVPQSLTANESFSSLLDFKKELSGKGLHSNFNSPVDFREKFTSHLNKLVNWFASHSAPEISLEDVTSPNNISEDTTENNQPMEQKTWWSMLHASETLTPEIMLHVDEAFEVEQSAEPNEHARITNQAAYYGGLSLKGDSEALSKLEEMADASSSNPKAMSTIQAALCRVYGYLGSKRLALDAADSALVNATTEPQKAIAVCLLGWCRQSWNDQEGAYQLLVDQAREVVGRKEAASIYESLADLYEENDQSLLQMLALEIAIEKMPENTSLRFSAALVSSELDMPLMNIRHYDSLLRVDPTESAAKNNLGSSLAKLSFPILSIESYRNADDLGLALSTANLAHRYIDAGFIEDGKRFVERAKMLGEEPRTMSAETRIFTEREEESKRKEEFDKISILLRAFVLQSANAVFNEEPSDISGQWRSNDGVLVTISSSQNFVQGAWTKDKLTYELQGVLRGNGILIDSIKWKSESPSSVFGSGSEVENSIGFFDAIRKRISILMAKGERPEYWILTPEDPASPDPLKP